MAAEPLAMSGAARLRTETTLEQLVEVLKLEVFTVVVPGPLVVNPEKIEYPCRIADAR